MASTSLTTTLAPKPLARMAQPRPQWPKPATTKVFAGQEDVGGADDAVDAGLPGAVDVIEFPLRFGVVDGHDRVKQLAVAAHGAQTMDAGGGFLGAANDAFGQLGMFVVDGEDQVRAVIEGQGGLEVERALDAPIEILDVLAVPGEDVVAFLG